MIVKVFFWLCALRLCSCSFETFWCSNPTGTDNCVPSLCTLWYSSTFINFRNFPTYTHLLGTYTFTLLCGIMMLTIYYFFYFFPCLHGLLGTARLFILLKNFYLHVYLELKSFHFIVKTISFSRFYFKNDSY